ncbi:MAG: PP0621 family protein [bacterium]
MKFILFIIALFLVFWIIRFLGRRSAVEKRPANDQEAMLRCAVCGVHLPASQALTLKGKSYCCKEHLEEDQTRQ